MEVERVHLRILFVRWLLHSNEAEVLTAGVLSGSDEVVLEVAKDPLTKESRAEMRCEEVNLERRGPSSLPDLGSLVYINQKSFISNDVPC